ncbi:MAG: D-alanyl-D-alanine carboxypeptidase [Rickettsiales bacterium]|jgi:D-alanyl-D-alanine carboxypeptidase (penicillin-binding protein 5/6)|nr:D-alanyl-D-alanine carboxypeptidase [Rickettsiales bacterium]
MKKIFLFLILFINVTFAIELNSKYAVLMDFDTGEILYEKSALEKTNPSSMTKIMTTYLIFEKLNDGIITLKDEFKVTENAWKQEGSRTFLNLNSKVSVDNLLKGLIVQSGNDAAIVLAEGVDGYTTSFVNNMNAKAKKMKLQTSSFTNPIGFSEINHYMSVLDLAILAKNLIQDYPTLYKRYFSIKKFKWNQILQYNRNKLLEKYNGVDGLKTGHTEAGGYGIVVSAKQDNRRLIVAVNGASSELDRETDATLLLNFGWKAKKQVFYREGELVKTFPVKYGNLKNVDIVSESEVHIWTLNNEEVLPPNIIFYKNIEAPLKKGERIGEIILGNKNYNLITKDEIKRVNLIIRLWRNLFDKN